MQIKKEEIRQTILESAQKEFLLHGYEGASMRTIAKKANTTLGNIYHYFENKEAILEVLLGEPVRRIEEMVTEHVKLQWEPYSVKAIEDILDSVEDILEFEEMQCLLDERLVIIFDLKTTHFVEDRDRIIKIFKKHLAWHLGMKDADSAYIDILLNTFIACLRHVILEHKGTKESKKEFTEVFGMLCRWLAYCRKEEK